MSEFKFNLDEFPYWDQSEDEHTRNDEIRRITDQPVSVDYEALARMQWAMLSRPVPSAYGLR